MKAIRLARMFLFFVPALPTFAAKHPPPPHSIPQQAKIFVDTNNGFDIFILAAFQSKAVAVELVSTVDKADYILDSSLFHSDQFAAVATQKAAGAGTYRISEAAFKLTSKSGDIIWAYAATKGMLSRGKQSVAEACAKHLKEIVK